MDTDGSLTVTECESLATVALPLFNLAVTVPDPALQARNVKTELPEELPARMVAVSVLPDLLEHVELNPMLALFVATSSVYLLAVARFNALTLNASLPPFSISSTSLSMDTDGFLTSTVTLAMASRVDVPSCN